MFEFTDFLIMELTYDCNLKCSYCYLSYDKFHNKEKMSFETYKSVIDEIIKQRKISKRTNLFTIVLHGGEPTLIGVELLDKMITYVKEKFTENGIKHNLTMQTNGLLLTEDFIPTIKKLDSLGLSFDGIGDAFNMRSSNDKIKERILSSIKLLNDNKVNFGFVSVLSKQNIDRLDEIYGINRSRVKLIPVYDVHSNDIDLDSGEFFEKIIKKDLENLSYINGSMSAATLDRTFKRVFVDLTFDHTDTCTSTCSFKFCGAGVRIVAIQPNGSVHRCDRWTINDDTKKHMFMGNHKDYDFLGIYQLKEAVKWNNILHNLNKENGCDTCYAKYACEFDCQALHYSKHKSFGVDKNRVCPSIKSLYRYVEEHYAEIINNFVEHNKVFVFEEDYIYGVKFRKNVMLDKLNVICTYEYKDGKTYVYFRRKNNA